MLLAAVNNRRPNEAHQSNDAARSAASSFEKKENEIEPPAISGSTNAGRVSELVSKSLFQHIRADAMSLVDTGQLSASMLANAPGA
jgi:hypothetical protein